VGVVALCLVVALPLAVGAWYSMVQRDLLNTVFADGASATRPNADPSNPWKGVGRVNVLLLGGDGGVDRVGIRTDSMIVASIDTTTGDTTLFSVPRNLMDAPFPKDSPLHKAYPDGFTGEGDAGEWMLNAVYRNVPAQHPGILGDSDNEGADALKLAMTGILGIRVDYYLLVNLAGFEKIVDAIGGVTVNINQPIPIGGNTDKGIPPKNYLDPGPHQHLDGFHALWFSRGRYGLDDYNRMERQRCMTKAIIDEANPLTLLRRYQALAEAGKKIVRTDIPQDMLKPFVELGLEVKDGHFKSVVFRPSEHFQPADPDYDWLHKAVQKALGNAPESKHGKKHDKPSESPSPTRSPSSEAPNDPCGYHPVG
ncbi:MAG: LCP family protein, partial [Nocardioidaceae bacterium]